MQHSGIGLSSLRELPIYHRVYLAPLGEISLALDVRGLAPAPIPTSIRFANRCRPAMRELRFVGLFVLR